MSNPGENIASLYVDRGFENATESPNISLLGSSWTKDPGTFRQSSVSNDAAAEIRGSFDRVWVAIAETPDGGTLRVLVDGAEVDFIDLVGNHPAGIPMGKLHQIPLPSSRWTTIRIEATPTPSTRGRIVFDGIVWERLNE